MVRLAKEEGKVWEDTLGLQGSSKQVNANGK
jgi:hypothetical protein